MRTLLSAALVLLAHLEASAQTTSYVRYRHEGVVAHGIVDGDQVRELSSSPIHGGTPTGTTRALADVTLLAPVAPGKVVAIGFNYKSHLGEAPAATEPGVFLKLPSSIVGPEAPIVIPEGATNVHYEGELVLVIGKRAKNVPPGQVANHVFGVTAGNDVSERDWQANDLQWFRAKASDSFGPMGPRLVSGLDYGSLLLRTRLNGEVVQEQRTSDLIFDIPRIVSYVSRFVTLEPGDVIYTGTPGTTRAMKPGDVVEVELEGVGVLRNPVTGPAR